jgi:hypothetical protein
MSCIYEKRIARIDYLRPLSETLRVSYDYKKVEYLMEDGSWESFKFSFLIPVEKSHIIKTLAKVGIVHELDINSPKYLLEEYGIHEARGYYTLTKTGDIRKIVIL